MKGYSLILLFISSLTNIIGQQNVGIGISTPSAKLHVKGYSDTSQLIIQANITQSNTNPLLNLRKSNGTDMMWIHSDHPTNTKPADSFK